MVNEGGALSLIVATVILPRSFPNCLARMEEQLASRRGDLEADVAQVH